MPAPAECEAAKGQKNGLTTVAPPQSRTRIVFPTWKACQSSLDKTTE